MSIKKEQIAIMNIQYKQFPFTRFLDDALRYDVKNIEIWGGAPHFYIEDLTYMEVQKIRREIESRGLRVSCLTPEQCVYPINIASHDLLQRKRSLKYFEHCIKAACEIGTDKILVTSGWGYYDKENNSESWAYAREGLYELAECAERYHIKLGLEVLRKDETNLVNDLSSLMKMLRELNHNSVGAILDLCSMIAAGETPEEYFDRLKKDLIHIHFIDGNPAGHLAWGDGTLNLDKYLKSFSEKDYRGSLSLEIIGSNYTLEPEISVRQSVEKIYSSIDKLN